MSDFNARAELHRLEMTRSEFGRKLPTSPRLVYSGTVTECVSKVMGKRDPDRCLYSMTVPLEAGFGKDVLQHDDIEAVFRRADFPWRLANHG
jgi:hypothetical protein